MAQDMAAVDWLVQMSHSAVTLASALEDQFGDNAWRQECGVARRSCVLVSIPI